MGKKDIESTKEFILNKFLYSGENILWEERPGAGSQERFFKKIFYISFIVGFVIFLIGLILMFVLMLGQVGAQIKIEESPAFYGIEVALFGGFLSVFSILFNKFIFQLSNNHYFITDKRIIRIDYASNLDEDDDEDYVYMVFYENVEKISINPPIQQKKLKRSIQFYSNNIIKQRIQDKKIRPAIMKKNNIEFKKIRDWYKLLSILVNYLDEKLEN
ncbi:MAG: hypothetical protein EAX96_08280 [Candidatus Lokiarchaeota archaeon]|nr:hypothetical protein [Candidatus Lokiarchaeota archaeon]